MKSLRRFEVNNFVGKDLRAGTTLLPWDFRVQILVDTY